MSVVISKSELCISPVIVLLYVISWYGAPCYNGTQLYTVVMNVVFTKTVLNSWKPVEVSHHFSRSFQYLQKSELLKDRVYAMKGGLVHIDIKISLWLVISSLWHHLDSDFRTKKCWAPVNVHVQIFSKFGDISDSEVAAFNSFHI